MLSIVQKKFKSSEIESLALTLKQHNISVVKQDKIPQTPIVPKDLESVVMTVIRDSQKNLNPSKYLFNIKDGSS